MTLTPCGQTVLALVASTAWWAMAVVCLAVGVR
jgi:hypothetical protein